jgi:hypothetical protein
MPERASRAVLVDFVSVDTGRRSVEEHDLGTPASGDVSREGHAGAVAVAIGPRENNEGGAACDGACD